MTLDTEPYRIAMVAYAHKHGLAAEPGFDDETHDVLGIPARRFLDRIQRNMVALKRGEKRVYPKVKVTGELDAATQAALIAPRPSWQQEVARIAAWDVEHNAAASYTESTARWQAVKSVFGVTKPDANIPTMITGDCSSSYTRWILWGLQQSLGHVPHDIVNSLAWNAGYTGTIAHTLVRVGTPAVGDAVLYGSYPYKHVTLVVNPANKTVCSHGDQDGPLMTEWDYRNDRAGFWRPNLGAA